MKIPIFTLENYSSIMQKPFDQSDSSQRLDFWEYISYLQPNFIEDLATVDARNISSTRLEDGNSIIGFSKKTFSYRQIVIATKLGSPTLYLCNYFFRDKSKGSHMGIDIIMPLGTPINSISDGKVARIKVRDGVTKNEGNCVVIKTSDNYYIGYEHLERIDVTMGQNITQGQILGTCGSTGNSTQYHVHLQVDTNSAPFHPYWHATAKDADKHTVDPIEYCRRISPKGAFVDIPAGPERNEIRTALQSLYKVGIVQGFNHRIFPNNSLIRYEAALLIDRICQKYNLYANLGIKNPTFNPYNDGDINDEEFTQASKRLQKYGIMKGHNNNFYPIKELQGAELLALLGRLFYGLKDNTNNPRRGSYKTKFLDRGLISSGRDFYSKSIPRKDVFVLLQKVLTDNNLI